MQRLFSQRGIGLLELLLSCALIAMMLTAVIRYVPMVRRSARVERAMVQVAAVLDACQQWSLRYHDFSSLSIRSMTDQGLLASSDRVSPWGKPLRMVTGAQTGTPLLTLDDLPMKDCQQLKQRVSAHRRSPVTCQVMGRRAQLTIPCTAE